MRLNIHTRDLDTFCRRDAISDQNLIVSFLYNDFIYERHRKSKLYDSLTNT